MIDPGLEELLKYVNNLISSAFELFVREFRNDYNRLLQAVKEKQREVEAVCKDATEKAEPELSKLEYLMKGFSEVKNMVL